MAGGLQLWWQRYLSGHKCITSKSAQLILIWRTSVSFILFNSNYEMGFIPVLLQAKYEQTYLVCQGSNSLPLPTGRISG